jgi:FAD/FMN-containing dehydrogenase
MNIRTPATHLTDGIGRREFVRSHNEQNFTTAREFWDGIEPFTRGYYVNADSHNGDQRLRAMYGENYPRLAQLKDKYDPMNLFRLNANIKPTAQA